VNIVKKCSKNSLNYPNLLEFDLCLNLAGVLLHTLLIMRIDDDTCKTRNKENKFDWLSL